MCLGNGGLIGEGLISGDGAYRGDGASNGLIGGEIRYININNDAVIIHSRVCWGGRMGNSG